MNADNEEILGFRVSATKGSYATGNGKSTVDFAYDCPNVPRAIKMVAAAFAHFLQESPFRVYDGFKYSGLQYQYSFVELLFTLVLFLILLFYCPSQRRLEATNFAV